MTAVTDLTAEVAVIKTDAAKLLTRTGMPWLMATNITDNTQLGVLPANAFILYATIRETTGKTISVGIGTAAGVADVLSPVTLAGAGVSVPGSAFNLGWFGAAAGESLFVSSDNWGRASVNVSLAYVVGP